MSSKTKDKRSEGRKGVARRRVILFGCTVALYAVLMSVAWVVGTHQAESKTEALLDYSVSDMRISINGVIDTLLEHLATMSVRHFRKPARYSMEEVTAVAKTFDIDEVNIVDRTGRIIATNDPDCLDVDMTAKDETRPFAELTNGVLRVVSQPFRRHAYADSRRKYLGVPFPGGNGYIQVGLDENRMSGMIASQLNFLFDAEVGDTMCYLCADVKTGALVSMQLEDGMAKTLGELGLDANSIPDADRPLPDVGGLEAGKTFEITLSGRRVFCRNFVFGGHRFLMIEPEDEFYGTRNMITAAMAVLLALVLGGFAIFLDRILRYSDKLKAFYAEEDARRAKDMEIAATIQNSALPTALPESTSFHLDASMQTAKEVGGDFYDYFMLDATHVAFLVADVSGKGITAALYMMTAKTIIKDSLLSLHDPAAALAMVNDELCANNPANMFLTAWVGVLDLETGVLTFVNAGHNPPIIKLECRDDGASRSKFVTERSGPVLAFMSGTKYTAHTLQLKPGDALFLYTDGVTEAMDSSGALFGEGRMMAALNAVKSPEPHALCSVVRSVVAAFSEGLPQADDITVLAVRYIEPPKVYSRSFPPTQAGIADVSTHIDDVVDRASGENPGLAQTAPTLHVIADEICSNIVRHSGASGFEVDIEITSNPAGAKIVFIDDGKAYDPLTHADPDTTLPVEKRPIGGLGIMMVKKMSDSIHYNRTHNRNFLTVEKHFPDNAQDGENHEQTRQ